MPIRLVSPGVYKAQTDKALRDDNVGIRVVFTSGNYESVTEG